MEKLIIIRYGELHLKGKNRAFFERLLIGDIKDKLKGFDCRFIAGHARYIVADFALEDTQKIVNRLINIFGIHSISIAEKCGSNINEIKNCALELMKNKEGSFKVETNRADKSFLHTSIEVSATIGEHLIKNNSNLTVDLHNPKTIMNIDIREEGYAFLFCEKILGLGGMPLGSAGKGLVLLSGGIDSPVAGFLMAKRGVMPLALHFHSYPYTNERAKQKVFDLASRLAYYTGGIKLINIKVTSIQEAIHKHCDKSYTITLLRIAMMKIAKQIAADTDCKCIINGESLGQVASQTLESIAITNSISDTPVFRPLIAMDKQEIINLAKAIGTFDISVLPFEDCCTVFLPEHPVIKPTMQKAMSELSKLTMLDDLINKALAEKEVAQL